MEYGQKAADLVAEYSLVEEVTTTQSRQLSKETAGDLSQNVKKLMLASTLVSLKTLDTDKKLSAEKLTRLVYCIQDYTQPGL